MNSAEELWNLPHGCRAVVTGGTRGIGAAVVEELARRGVRVLTCARNRDELQQKINEWQEKRYHVDGRVVNLASASGRSAFAETIGLWLNGSPLDILVNNVGLHTAHHYGEEEEELIWETNYHSTLTMMTLCHEHLKSVEDSPLTSSVVNIASIAGFKHFDSKKSAYAAAKSSVIKTTAELACSWGNDGIRVNCVCPWLIQNEKNEELLSDTVFQKSVSTRVPLRRMGSAIEVAGLVTYLCLPMAGFLTGQVICVDGGYSRSEYYDDIVSQERQEAAKASTTGNTEKEVVSLMDPCETDNKWSLWRKGRSWARGRSFRSNKDVNDEEAVDTRQSKPPNPVASKDGSVELMLKDLRVLQAAAAKFGVPSDKANFDVENMDATSLAEFRKHLKVLRGKIKEHRAQSRMQMEAPAQTQTQEILKIVDVVAPDAREDYDNSDNRMMHREGIQQYGGINNSQRLY